MGRWSTQDEMVCVKGTVVCYAAQDEEEAARIVRKHNADCNAYESRIAALQAALETESKWLAEYQKQRDDAVDRLARIAALVRPVPVADLVETGTEAPRLLAERHAKIRAILEEVQA